AQRDRSGSTSRTSARRRESAASGGSESSRRPDRGVLLGRRRAPATPSACRRVGAASRVHWRRYVSTSPRSGPYPTMDASPLGADGRMPLALRGLGLVGEGGHVLRAVDDLVRGGDGIWLGDGDRFELVLGLA